MKVFEISPFAKPPYGRFESYADLDLREHDVKRLRQIGLGHPYPREWRSFQFSIRTPLLPRPDFYGIVGAWVVNERVLELAGEPLEMSGELLPVTIEAESGHFYIYNLTNTINVLDREKTIWHYLGGHKEFAEPRKPAFHADRFGEESLFKFSESIAGIYCLERTGDPDDGEFKALVERHGLTGLLFEEIWTDDK